MKKYLTTLASFIIMLCLGGVYAWSVTASELIERHGFSSTQTQLIFGSVIAIFPVTMIFAGKLSRQFKARVLGWISAFFFLLGYLLAGFSYGNFYLVFLGAGVLAGIGTGFGYLVALTVPVKWFPGRKGLITGIAAAGFGLGAIVLSTVAEMVLQWERSIFFMFRLVGIVYGIIIFLFAGLLYQPSGFTGNKRIPQAGFLSTLLFRKLFTGIFLGTFSGLLIIGSLKIIGGQHAISNHILMLGVSVFAVMNFLGRLFWGFISDYVSAGLNIFLALTLQALAIVFIGTFALTGFLYLLSAALTGFGFGGNFVLFAKETVNRFGLDHLETVYPYVFIGYAIAGIAGPLTGGLLFDYFGNFTYAALLAGGISLSGGLLFLFHYFRTSGNKHGHEG